jgi:hypothetical protein
VRYQYLCAVHGFLGSARIDPLPSRLTAHAETFGEPFANSRHGP